MKYEKEIKIKQAAGSSSKGRNELASLCTDRGICKNTKNAQRRQEGYCRKASGRSGGYAADHFLKQVFKTKAVGFYSDKKLRFTKDVLREFNSSLFQLLVYYNIQFQLSNTGIGFLDCLINFRSLQSLLSESRKLELRLARDSRGRISLCTAETFPTGYCLYYIPVIPLYRFLKDKQFHRQKGATLVLLSACSYLFRYAGVSMYDDSSYLGYQYDYLEGMTKEEIEYYPLDSEYAISNLQELKTAKAIRELVTLKLSNEQNLLYLEQRISNINHHSQYEQNCQLIGRKVLDLYQNHKDKNIFRYAACLKFRERDDHYMTRMDQYISFLGSNEGGIADMLFEMVNNELNENMGIQEPEIVYLFNGEPIEEKDFEFEKDVFNLIDDVCTVLNNY